VPQLFRLGALSGADGDDLFQDLRTDLIQAGTLGQDAAGVLIHVLAEPAIGVWIGADLDHR